MLLLASVFTMQPPSQDCICNPSEGGSQCSSSDVALGFLCSAFPACSSGGPAPRTPSTPGCGVSGLPSRLHGGADLTWHCQLVPSELTRKETKLLSVITVIFKRKGICMSVQSCLTLCDPVDCSPPGSSVHWIPQARTLEWVASSFSRGSS